MAQLKHDDYTALESALAKGTRVLVKRPGRSEYLIIPQAFRTRDGRELIEARHPTTGHLLTIYLDEIDSIQAMS